MAVSATSLSLPPSVEFDAQLIKKLTLQGPRYTSYPTADRFSEAFDYGDFLQTVTNARARNAQKPLSLYIHIPFCDKLCYYCACNKIITKRREKAVEYLDYLKREISLQSVLFKGMNHVEQLHFGGGTPTYLSDEQMEDLMAHLRHCFQFAEDESGEYSIEIDPRTVTRERIINLRRQGFNRLSLGVQDFDSDVQKAVNRIQPESMTLDAINAARSANYRSVSVDLIYGLPRQNLISIGQTLNKVIAADPDRISIYNYAHMPHLFKPQRRIAEEDLPGSDAKLDMLYLCIKRLTNAGYVYIGMDHFAKPTDDLAMAQQQGRLHRNFQGYSTHADKDLISCGVSAISAIGPTYSQNAKTLETYYDRLDKNELPIARGIRLSMDDLLRRGIIQRLMCNFELSIKAIEQAYPISFREYFSSELVKLKLLEGQGLLEIENDWVTVSLKGRLLIRNICMVFDKYLGVPRRGASNTQPLHYSRTI
jgi:oxygen-independent coproporphyrinogen-3 oxidase